MDRKGFKDFARRYVEYLESEEGRIDFLAHVYLSLNGRTVVQDFIALGSDNSMVH